MIKLIINADDFGYSKIFNVKILDLIERGAIKSTTVLMRMIGDDQKEQIDKLIELHKSKMMGVGIEFVLDSGDVFEEEIRKQYDKFVKVLRFTPSHFSLHLAKRLRDSVDYSQKIKQISDGVARLAKEKNIPFDNDKSYGIDSYAGIKTTTQQDWTITYHRFDEIAEHLGRLEDGESYLIHSHPGEYDPNSKSSLNKERKEDYDNILRLQKYLKEHENVKSISFLEL